MRVLDQISEQEVIEAILRGNVERYAELVERHQNRAVRLAFSLLGNYEDARDVSQEAFVSAYVSLRNFHRGSAFSTWLYRIVVNKCKDFWRKRSHQPAITAMATEVRNDEEGPLFTDADDPASNPSERALQHELSVEMSRAIQALPPRQKTAFVLHHLNGFSLNEVSETMGCRLGTVKAHIFRANENLRLKLAPWLTREGVT
ncbi:MAG: RNA polymerase sigma factor [Candidatus Omnitrophica bacterium]|nr:RNA polymerase sigma factor [Candidatus Omnitrophota bacterium]